MHKIVAQLKKLRGKDMRELRVRGSQEVAKLGGRALGLGVGEMSDAGFHRAIKPGQRDFSPADTAAYIRNRVGASVASAPHSSLHQFFPSLGYREEIIEIMERRFPAERDRIIDCADRAIRGKFDLLGLSDISFGNPIDWRLEPLSGKRTPLDHWSKIDYLNPEAAGDKKITWELNRHAHFVSLGQAYWITGDERYAAAFVSQASSWMNANPPGRGINWTSSLEVAFRSIAWLWALHLLATSPELTSSFVLRLLKFLIAHGRHIESYLSHYFSPNTHLTGEALALFYLGTALRELRQEKAWRERGLQVLLEQLPQQVRADGVYFEQASYYHRYTVDFYTHLLLLGRASGLELPAEVEHTLVQMLDHLAWITRPDSASSLIGDDDGGRLIKLGERSVDDFRDTLAIGAALFGRQDWKFVAGRAPVEMLWLLGPDGVRSYDRIISEPPQELSRAFDASGYYVIRDGWSPGSSYLIVDCGPHGSLACGHAHSDALAFEFAASGKSWLVDPGTFTYTADPQLRDEFRGTEAHNTVTVDGESQSIPAGPFSWGQIARTAINDFIAGDGFGYFEGSHFGYERLADPVIHKRAILFVKTGSSASSLPQMSPYLVVRDTFSARSSHRYSIKYHISPGCSVMADGNRVIVSEPGGRRLNITVFGRVAPQAHIVRGWVSRGYGKREMGLVVSFEAEGEGPQEFATFIMPSALAQSVRVEQTLLREASVRGFQITSEKMLDVLLMGDGTSAAECGPLAASGLMAWGRFANNELYRACLVRGQKLETKEGVVFSSTAPVRQCAIERFNNRIEVSTGSVSRTGNTLCGPPARLIINGASFFLDKSWNKAAFANDGSGWRLADVG